MAEEGELLKKYNSVYLSVIMRYRDYIEEKEALNVAELPGLITPGDDAIVSLAERIKSGYGSYTYEENFPEAAASAYRHAADAVTTVSLPIQFWQRAGETVTNAAGDAFDKAVLLCSLLIALGNASAKIIVVTGENERSIAVYFGQGEGIIYMDVEKGRREFDTKEQMLMEILGSKSGEASAYEFNDKMYANLT